MSAVQVPFTKMIEIKLMKIFHDHIEHFYCVKSVRIRSYSGPHIPAFGLNTVFLRI